MPADVVVGVDFGTSFTVAAMRRDREPARVIEVGGHRRQPSVIFAEEGGSLLYGAAAEALTLARPARGLRAPKQLVGHSESVVLGGERHQLADLIGGLLRDVLRHADREAGGPSQLVLTHPADWSARQLETLQRAAAAAGAVSPSYVTEPVAGARACVDRDRHPAGTHVVVYDLGGGTLDIAVLEVRPNGYDVVGRPTGDRSLGGDLFDEVLMTHIGEQRLDAEVWAALCDSEEPAWLAAAARLRGEVRRAKELLSLHSRADVTISLPSQTFAVVIERDELSTLLLPLVEESARLCEETVLAADLTPERIGAVHLIGGGSQLPLIGRAIGARFPRSQLVQAADPKAVVALGATMLGAAPARTQPARTQPTPHREPPVLPPPLSPPPAASPASVPSAVAPQPPVSQPPLSPPPAVAPRPPASQPPLSQPPVSQPPVSQAFRLLDDDRLGAQRRRALLVLLAVAACITAVVLAVVTLV